MNFMVALVMISSKENQVMIILKEGQAMTRFTAEMERMKFMVIILMVILMGLSLETIKFSEVMDKTYYMEGLELILSKEVMIATKYTEEQAKMYFMEMEEMTLSMVAQDGTLSSVVMAVTKS